MLNKVYKFPRGEIRNPGASDLHGCTLSWRTALSMGSVLMGCDSSLSSLTTGLGARDDEEDEVENDVDDAVGSFSFDCSHILCCIEFAHQTKNMV